MGWCLYAAEEQALGGWRGVFSFLVFGLRWRVLARFFVEKRFFWGNWAVTGLEIWLEFFFGGGMVFVRVEEQALGGWRGVFSFLVFGLRWRVLARFFVEKRFFWGNWAVTGLEIWL